MKPLIVAIQTAPDAGCSGSLLARLWKSCHRAHVYPRVPGLEPLQLLHSCMQSGATVNRRVAMARPLERAIGCQA
jgi:hypothetical protein